MRKKLILATTAGALVLTGAAVAVPALAEESRSSDPSSSAVERITDALSGLISDGSITQEQADEVATTLDEAGIGRGHGGGHVGGHGARLDLSAAATALDLTEDELRTALEPEGTTLAQVADDQDVPVDALVDALVQAEQDHLAQAVEDGRLTQDEADERLADAEERVTDRVNSADLARGHGPRGGGPDGAPDEDSAED